MTLVNRFRFIKIEKLNYNRIKNLHRVREGKKTIYYFISTTKLTGKTVFFLSKAGRIKTEMYNKTT